MSAAAFVVMPRAEHALEAAHAPVPITSAASSSADPDSPRFAATLGTKAVNMVGVGINPDGWTGIESVASLRLSLELDGAVANVPTDTADIIGQLSVLQASIATERRRRAVSRAIMREMARDAARLERIERVARLFAFIHIGLNGLELFLGSLQGLGAMTAVLALIGMRVRHVALVYLYVVWLLVDLGLDIWVDVKALEVEVDPVRADSRLRGVIVSIVVQTLLVLATLYVMVRYVMALRRWRMPRLDVDETIERAVQSLERTAAADPAAAAPAADAAAAARSGQAVAARAPSLPAEARSAPAAPPGGAASLRGASPPRRSRVSSAGRAARRQRRLDSQRDGLWADSAPPGTPEPHWGVEAGGPGSTRRAEGAGARSYAVLVVPAGSRGSGVAAAPGPGSQGRPGGGAVSASSSWRAHRQTLRSSRSARVLRRLQSEHAALTATAAEMQQQ